MDVYRKNLEVLQQTDRQVALWIDNAVIDDRYRVTGGNGKPPNLEIIVDGGEKVRLYPGDDPVNMIRRSIENQEFFKQDFSCLIGFGVGYLAILLAEKMEPEHQIYVFEPDNTILKIAFNLIDFSPLIKNSQLTFILPETESIQSAIMKMDTKFLSGKMRVIMESYCSKLSSQYESIRNTIQETGDLKRIALDTGALGRNKFLKTHVMNIPNILHSASIKCLENRFKGIPAVLISNGPSLGKNIHLLNQVKGRAVTIGVAQGLRPLLASGFEPDLITSVDPFELNFLQIKGLFNIVKIPLIYNNSVNYRIANSFQDNRFYIPRKNQIDFWLGSFLNFKEFYREGTAVVHTSFIVAELMGCDPIVFVGQDLAYSNMTHMKGTDYNKFVHGEHQKGLVWVKDIYGKVVSTSVKLRAQKTVLERFVKNAKACCINATEGGAGITGTLVMPLSEVIRRYCGVKKDIKGKLKTAFQPILSDPEKIAMELEKKQKDLKKINRLAEKGIKINVDLYNRLVVQQEQDTDLIKNLAEQNIEITKKIDSFQDTRQQLTAFSIGEHRLMSCREFNPEETDGASSQMEAMLKRNRVFLEGMKKSSEVFHDSLTSIVPFCKVYGKLAKQLGQDNKNPLTLYRMGYALASRGFLRQALENLLKSYENGKKDVRICYRIARCYLKMESYSKAKFWFEKTDQISPDYRNVRRCLKCLEGLDDLFREQSEHYLNEKNYVYAAITGLKWKKFRPDSKKAYELINKSFNLYRNQLNCTHMSD